MEFTSKGVRFRTDLPQSEGKYRPVYFYTGKKKVAASIGIGIGMKNYLRSARVFNFIPRGPSRFEVE